ncbi:transcription factor TFIIIB component B'' homolog [Metopolophium dirhodum]|uniref:transcription factor TFIIIB component B'' homolog n=1 Tax=Metopolophium dirhodum TaxID=44670 RepID=UPI00298FA8CB|nr:transcription factor TFIIIB component B'' homolog [Metopolophium dirhodum]XP_060878915.1 transcription factor TFIIIB component B'' homolog [Metopolophium dirhodum]
MSTPNTKSVLNRHFPFAKKKPNIPSKLSDKVDTKINKQKLIEEKSFPIVKTTESNRCDVLTENNEKAKPIQEKLCGNEIPKRSISTTFKTIISQNDDSDIISKKKKSISRKSSNVSEVSIGEIKKPKENYQRWNIPFSSKFKGKEFDKTLLTMQDLIYYNPVANPIIKEPKVEHKEEDDPDNDLLSIDSEQKPTVQNNCITPCIKVGIDGKIIIDQETLTLNETGLEEKREELAKSKVIEESAYHSRSYSYKRKKEASKQWSKDETLKFYKCLMNFGTDFSMIQQYCPNRTRAQIKRKYKTEEKKNLQLVNGALTNTTHFDSASIEDMLENDKIEENVVEKLDKSADPEVSTKNIDRRRHKDIIRSDCRKISMCAYLLEEEIEMRNKRKRPTEIITAKKLKKELVNMPSIKNKKKNHTQSSLNIVTNKESFKHDIDENKDGKPKVRTLQDFHEEYEECITKYEESNSE